MRGNEKLCVFGNFRSRRGAEIKVMSAVEHKHPGYFCDKSTGGLKEVHRIGGDKDAEGWRVETRALGQNDYSYALGSRGTTRKKLAAASGLLWLDGWS